MSFPKRLRKLTNHVSSGENFGNSDYPNPLPFCIIENVVPRIVFNNLGAVVYRCGLRTRESSQKRSCVIIIVFININFQIILNSSISITFSLYLL